MTAFKVPMNPNFKSGSGLAGSFTWSRLEGILRAAHELRDNESIDGYEVSNTGVNFYVKKVDKKVNS